MKTPPVTRSFSDRIYFVGRLTVVICLTCFIMLPIALSWIFKAPIDYAVTLNNGLSILITFTLSAVFENISYAPIIGPGALYTSCVTGDVSNMKVPASINAMEVLGVKPGTEKGDIVSILSTSTCTFVTTGLAFLGMVFLAPIVDPIFQNPIIKPAFTNLVPALFGAMLIPFLLKNPKETLPIVALPILTVFVVGRKVFPTIQGYLLMVFAIISITYSYFLHRDELRQADVVTAGTDTEE